MMSSSKVIEYAIGLLESHQFASFRFVAIPSPTQFQAMTNAISQTPGLNGMTLLHAATVYNPPTELVIDMLQISPTLIKATDDLGRTPLHMAAGSGVNPDLIKFLANIYPASCVIRDVDGKTPLHHVCDTSCGLFVNDTADHTTRRLPCHESVKALLSESLHAAIIEDADEMTALEHAILNNAELKTVKLLQHAAVKVHKQSARESPKIPRRITE
jgi:ankyrin repeat protein